MKKDLVYLTAIGFAIYYIYMLRKANKALAEGCEGASLSFSESFYLNK